VVDWRRPQETIKALLSLHAMDPRPDDLICVENGSLPGQVDEVRRIAPPNTVIVRTQRNVGFAAGVNLGAAEATRRGAQWMLLLNNDATVAPDCLGRCLEEVTGQPEIAVVGPAVALADDPDRLWFGGGAVSDHFAFTRHTGLRRPTSDVPPGGDVGFVSACCALISMRAWQQVGPFRDDYFAYYEDAEWCQRARKAGWRCRYLGEVLCWHAVGVSSDQRGSFGLTAKTAYYLARNPLRFALETRSPSLRLSRVAGLMVVWNAYNFWRLLTAHSGQAVAAYFAGLTDAFRGRMGPRTEDEPDCHGGSGGSAR
jgi:GT2 family glycosyltransferase